MREPRTATRRPGTDAPERDGGGAGLAEALAMAQGGYFVATGVWPLLSIGTFQAVTGPKTDLWLVKTVGCLVGVVGAALAVAGLRRRLTPEVALLGAGSAAALGAVDVWYAARGRISPIYLADAAAEAALCAGWLVAAGNLASREENAPA